MVNDDDTRSPKSNQLYIEDKSSNLNETESSQNNGGTNRKKRLIVGGSIVKNIEGWRLNKRMSEKKRTVFYDLETISCGPPQLWTILPVEFKQRNTISLFKSDVRQWICNECPCRVYKVLVPNLGFT